MSVVYMWELIIQIDTWRQPDMDIWMWWQQRMQFWNDFLSAALNTEDICSLPKLFLIRYCTRKMYTKIHIAIHWFKKSPNLKSLKDIIVIISWYQPNKMVKMQISVKRYEDCSGLYVWLAGGEPLHYVTHTGRWWANGGQVSCINHDALHHKCGSRKPELPASLLYSIHWGFLVVFVFCCFYSNNKHVDVLFWKRMTTCYIYIISCNG